MGITGKDADRRRVREESRQLADFLEYVEELDRESERGAVLVAATRVDELLREAIAARLVDHPDTAALLDGFNAPLGTFSARTLAAMALGLLSENEYRDCIAIRKIRNEFAHKLGVNFGDQKIVDLCNNLTLGFTSRDSPDDHRQRFSSAAFVLVAYLTRRAEHASKERLTWRYWGFTDITDR
jgi:mannitol operon repressor